MASEIEKERETLLNQINNQGRLLEQRTPADAQELNKQLGRLVEWLVTRSNQKADPREPKGT